MPRKRKELKIKGPNLWYLVGLITSDGSLSSDGRHIDITSIDGDGCIRRWLHPSNKREQWSLRIYSGSEPFAKWLDNNIETLIRVKGRVHRDDARNISVLKYGKMAAKEIAQKCYYKDCLGLTRKIELAKKCELSYTGWEQSKTVLN